MVAKTRSLHTVLGAGGAGRQFMMRHFASPAKRNHHAPAVSGTSFVRPLAACSVPSSPPLYQSTCDYYNRTVNANNSSVSGAAGFLSCPLRLVSSSTPGASPPSETQPQYFEGGPWHEKYLLLKEYKKEHGNCLVPPSHQFGEAKLGVWVNTQRQLYKKGKLSSNRREMLDALGFSWDPLADKWERNFALLEQFKEREGHSNAPRDHQEEGVKLGEWISRQRQLYRNGNLDESYQRRLENLGMSWDPHAVKWERKFALLEQFQGRECHIDVPWLFEENGIKLGTWVGKQRRLYKKGKLDECYQHRLEKLGVSWDPHTEQWERNFILLKQYKEREGHCNVPNSHEEDGVKLGS